jgi:peptide/nickel transport system permease protein
VKERLYVDRSRALGASSSHLMGRHIMPNIAPLILANTTLTVPIAILSETTLSFLGLGDPTRPSWGKMLEEGFAAGALSQHAWWYYVPPGLGVMLVVLAFVLCGHALEEILDPRLREQRS